MKRHLTLVSPAKTLKRAASKRTAFVSGGYDYNARDFMFAREHDRSTGELQPLKMPVPYLTIIGWCLAVAVVLGILAWIV